jgi:phenylpropionate dioxygenase-like ring-hydroxylating dioxygenase large terminal subunit
MDRQNSNAESYDVYRTWPVNPDAPEDSYEAKAPFIDSGCGPMSKERYYSAAWMEAEQRKLWPKVWNWAIREEDIPEPGDFRTFRIAKENILIVRGEDMVVRAFYNVCPHRGNRLVMTDQGAFGDCMTCPFHRWKFDFSGKNQHITDRQSFRADALQRNADLEEIRCESWDGFIFINMDKSAIPLREHLGPLVDHALPYRLKDMLIMRRVRSVWDSNWKVGFDGFAEAYHVHAIHPQILPIFDDYHTQIDLYTNGMSRAITKFATPSPRLPAQGLNEGLRALMKEAGVDPDSYTGDVNDVRPLMQKAKRQRSEALGLDWSGFLDGQLTDDWNYAIFPNILLGLHPEGANLLYFRPHPDDPRKFIFDVIILMHPQKGSDIVPPAYMGLPEGVDLSGEHEAEVIEVDWREGGLGLLFDQDSMLFTQIQEGVESLGFRGAILSQQEMRLGHFHAELDRYMQA